MQGAGRSADHAGSSAQNAENGGVEVWITLCLPSITVESLPSMHQHLIWTWPDPQLDDICLLRGPRFTKLNFIFV
jgi:hypothetical protein